jgi:hypothetical protein
LYGSIAGPPLFSEMALPPKVPKVPKVVSDYLRFFPYANMADEL